MISRKKKVRLFQRKEALHKAKAQQVYKYLWRHSLQSGTSAFHGSCRTSTAKLRSRVCRGGESCMRSFLSCCVFMRLYFIHSLAASTLSSGRRKIRSAACPSVLLSYRCVHEGVQKGLSAPGRISPLHKIPSRKFLVLHGLYMGNGKWDLYFLDFTARRCYRSL